MVIHVHAGTPITITPSSFCPVMPVSVAGTYVPTSELVQEEDHMTVT